MSLFSFFNNTNERYQPLATSGNQNFKIVPSVNTLTKIYSHYNSLLYNGQLGNYRFNVVNDNTDWGRTYFLQHIINVSAIPRNPLMLITSVVHEMCHIYAFNTNRDTGHEMIWQREVERCKREISQAEGWNPPIQKENDTANEHVLDNLISNPNIQRLLESFDIAYLNDNNGNIRLSDSQSQNASQQTCNRNTQNNNNNNNSSYMEDSSIAVLICNNNALSKNAGYWIMKGPQTEEELNEFKESIAALLKKIRIKEIAFYKIDSTDFKQIQFCGKELIGAGGNTLQDAIQNASVAFGINPQELTINASTRLKGGIDELNNYILQNNRVTTENMKRKNSLNKIITESVKKILKEEEYGEERIIVRCRYEENAKAVLNALKSYFDSHDVYPYIEGDEVKICVERNTMDDYYVDDIVNKCKEIAHEILNTKNNASYALREGEVKQFTPYKKGSGPKTYKKSKFK